MGNQLPQFQKINWYPFKGHGDKKNLFHNGKGIYSQKYTFPQPKKYSAKEELSIYKERSKVAADSPLVSVYWAEIQEEKKNFCSVLHNITVYAEYIPNRLSHIKSFSLSEAQTLYVLRESLKAFEELFEQFGFFKIESDLIGFSVRGKVKCWLTQRFECNRIDQEDNVFNATGSKSNQKVQLNSKLKQDMQKSMVCEVWETVKKKSNIRNRELFFKLSKLEEANFEAASQIVQYLIKVYHSPIPESLNFENNIGNVSKKSYDYSKIQNTLNALSEKGNQTQIQTLDVSGFDPQSEKDRNFLKMMIDQPIIKDFDAYRQHIEQKNTLLQNQSCSKSEKVVEKALKQNEADNSDQRSIKEMLGGNPENNAPAAKKNSKKGFSIDKTIEISFSTIHPSMKTIVSEEQPQSTTIIPSPPKQQVQNKENIVTSQISDIPLLSLKRTNSYVSPPEPPARERFALLNPNPSEVIYHQYPYSPRQMINSSRRILSPNFPPKFDDYDRTTNPGQVVGQRSHENQINSIRPKKPQKRSPDTPNFQKYWQH